MAMGIPSIEDYLIKHDKDIAYWICFNTYYNDICAFGVKQDEIDERRELENSTDIYGTRDLFLRVMRERFPLVKITRVCESERYLGSFAIDCAENDEVFKALSELFDDENGLPASNRAVIYEITREQAENRIKKREAEVESFDDF